MSRFQRLKKKIPSRNNTSVGIISLLTIFSQMYVGKQTDRNMSQEFDELRLELVQMKLDREKNFAKKEEIRDLAKKIDQMHLNLKSDIGKVDTQVADIRIFL